MNPALFEVKVKESRITQTYIIISFYIYFFLLVRKHISSQDHVVGQNIGNTRELELGNVSSKPERLEPVHRDKEFVGEGHLEKY